jgi:phosphate transport system substrate-binding protein
MFDGPHNASQMITAGSVSRRDAMVGVATLAVSMSIVSSRHVAAEEPLALRIGGTGMALAAMRQIGDAFTATQPHTIVKVLPSLGTGGGLAAVTAGGIDVAVAARGLNDAERAKGLQCFSYAQTPLAFVTHPDVGVAGVTLAEVAAILAGRRLAWPNGTAIRLIRREPSDADWSLLRTMSPEMAAAVQAALERSGLLTPATDQENADALERLPGSFGAISIGQLRAESRRISPIVLDGEPPTVEALAGKRYPLARTLYVASRSQPTEEVARFLAFLSSEQAAELLTRLGHIPLAGTGT